MPGVPFEMKTAMSDDIIPRLQAQFLVKQYLSHTYLVSGIAESELAIRLAEFETMLPAGFSLAYLPSFGFIRLRLSVWGEEHKQEMKQLGHKLKQLLGEEFVARSENQSKHSSVKSFVSKTLPCPLQKAVREDILPIE